MLQCCVCQLPPGFLDLCAKFVMRVKYFSNNFCENSKSLANVKAFCVKQSKEVMKLYKLKAINLIMSFHYKTQALIEWKINSFLYLMLLACLI